MTPGKTETFEKELESNETCRRTTSVDFHKDVIGVRMTIVIYDRMKGSFTTNIQTKFWKFGNNLANLQTTDVV